MARMVEESVRCCSSSSHTSPFVPLVFFNALLSEIVIVVVVKRRWDWPWDWPSGERIWRRVT